MIEMGAQSTTRRLRLAVLADPELPVPPTLYGGIERVIHFLVEGLASRGHEVTLFAHRESTAACHIVPYPGLSSHSRVDIVRNAATIARGILGRQVDVVHSFGRLAYMTPLALSRIPKLMSFQRPITPASIASATRLFGDTLQFSVCGEHMIGELAPLATWHVVPNGVPMASYTFNPDVPATAPLVFLGRIERIKGPHTAIAVARRTGRPLVLAGNIAAEHQGYFDQEIAPHIDGEQVRYVGPVNDTQKNVLLGSSAALLMPIEWDEPFGIVMAEALACGTPVVGLRRGAVPEVVADGVTGFVADDVDGLVAGVGRLSSIDRRACRGDAEKRFSDEVIVDAYEGIYQRLVWRSAPAAAAGVVRHLTP